MAGSSYRGVEPGGRAAGRGKRRPGRWLAERLGHHQPQAESAMEEAERLAHESMMDRQMVGTPPRTAVTMRTMLQMMGDRDLKRKGLSLGRRPVKEAKFASKSMFKSQKYEFRLPGPSNL